MRSCCKIKAIEFRCGCEIILRFPVSMPNIVINGPETIMYQPIPSLTIPQAKPGNSHVLTARGVGFLPKLSLPGGSGF